MKLRQRAEHYLRGGYNLFLLCRQALDQQQSTVFRLPDFISPVA